jgi:hypothetical protein
MTQISGSEYILGNNVLYSGGRKKQRQRLVRYEKKVIYRERKTNIKNTG